MTLLVTQVVADHHDPTVTTDHLALLADRLDARLNLHVVLISCCVVVDGARPQTTFPEPGMVGKSLLVAVDDATAREVVGGKLHHDAIFREDANVVLTHLSADVGENFVAVLELNAEHCIGQRLDYSSLDLDGPVFLSHILRDPC